MISVAGAFLNVLEGAVGTRYADDNQAGQPLSVGVGDGCIVLLSDVTSLPQSWMAVVSYLMQDAKFLHQ